jgi:hypothetical protein
MATGTGKVDGMKLVEGLLTLLAELVPEGSEATAATAIPG